jgi:hypothetical protein
MTGLMSSQPSPADPAITEALAECYDSLIGVDGNLMDVLASAATRRMR